ncbi:hypothetical protein [Bauldia litoralis]|uniref:hypothetical protein n=2 Tax=Bauldia litoralis TaxID=665467 RepID=UPI003267349B
MKRLKKTAIVWLAIIVGIGGLELGAELGLPGVASVVAPAEARVGRPLTPVSYAGVARRTTRRVVRRTSYRVATLPPGCPYGPYYGGYYYYCGGRYYEQSGNVYVQVVFE